MSTATIPQSGNGNGQPLHIVEFEAIDFKRLRALRVTPGDKCIVILKGPNEAGKTSALDAWRALVGGAREAPDQPIRVGAESSRVSAKLADATGPKFALSRVFRGDGKTALAVRAITPEGEATLTGAQGWLDAIIADLSFDPREFARATAADQIRMLFAAIGAADQYTAAQGRRKALYEQRTEINRTVTTLTAKLRATPDPSPDKLLAEVSDTEFAQKLEDAQQHNACRTKLGVAIEQRTQRVAALRDQIRMIEGEIARLTAANTTDKNALDGMPAAVDTTQITAAVARNRQTADQARQQREARKTATELEQAKAAADAKTAAMEAIDAELRAVIEQSNIGQTVPGLAVTPAGITHNGVPLSQASGMRSLEISCLVGMAANKRLRVMRIDEGDGLDPQAMKHLEDIARKYDFQILMTAVYAGEETEHTAVYQLADGAIVGAEPAPPADATAPGGGSKTSEAPVGRSHTAKLAAGLGFDL